MIFPEWKKEVKKWLDVAYDFEISPTTASKYLLQATRNAFPNREGKHMAFNGLRHSYAINLLAKEVAMSFVAQCLGNTERVCQDHYVGFQLSTNAMDLIHMKLNESA